MQYANELEAEYSQMSEYDRKRILQRGSIVLIIIASILSFFSLIMILGLIFSFDLTVLIVMTIILFLPTTLFWFLAFRKLHWSEDKRHDYILLKMNKTAYRTSKESEKEANIGQLLLNNQKSTKPKYSSDADRFANDIAYQNKVMNKVKRKEDALYNKNIRVIEKNLKNLSNQRQTEISKLNAARWEKIYSNILFTNDEEGLVKINNVIYPFNKILGAEMNVVYGNRIETNTIEHTNAKAKKHGSLGGAVVGGLVAGPVGVLVGGVGMGKTTTKGKSTCQTTTNNIPTCTHMGVNVNVDGFIMEIILISSQVDQSSMKFISSQQKVQNIIALMQKISQTSMPAKIIPIEQKPSVLEYDRKIEAATNELKAAKVNVPTYDIPEKYRTQDNAKLLQQDVISQENDNTNIPVKP